jgi:hypothetical protein
LFVCLFLFVLELYFLIMHYHASFYLEIPTLLVMFLPSVS